MTEKLRESNENSQVEVVTFGCRLNSYESEVMRDSINKSGLSDAIVINSCAVTNQAEKNLQKEIKKLRKNNPNKKIILTGCAAQINYGKYAKMEAVDFVIGNSHKTDEEIYKQISDGVFKPKIERINGDRFEDKKFKEITEDLEENDQKILVNDIMSISETAGHLVTSFQEQSRAFVQIQNGCNHRCTFCIIPYGRGNSRSVPFSKIVQEVESLVQNGYNEVVLTGVDITDYGLDLPGKPSLSSIVHRLLNTVPHLPRLRLSSIDVAEIDDEMIEIYAKEPRFMPYFHISLQSGDDIILKRMKRRHTRQKIVDFCKKIRDINPSVGLGADIIAGFPTENEEMFENSLQLIKECKIAFCHIFPFSPKNGTPAAKMPQVAPQLIKKRVKQLISAGNDQHNALKNLISGTLQNVLVEARNIGR